MKILTTIHNLDNLKELSLISDGFLIGNYKYAKALTLSIDNINDVASLIKDYKKEVYVLFNKMFTDFEIDELKEYIKTLNLNNIDGFIGADIGLLKVFKDLGIIGKFIYNPETLLTSYFDFNYFSDDNIKGAFSSKEITLDDVLNIGKEKKYKLFYFGHGNMSMFYSKRRILSLFNEVSTISNPHNKYDISLIESSRDEQFPILEDDAGTHIFRGEVLSSLDSIESLKEVVDYFVVDTLFKDDNYALSVIPLYKGKTLNKELIEEIKNKYNEKWHDGFLSKESVIRYK